MISLPKFVTAAAVLVSFTTLGCHQKRSTQDVAVSNGSAKIVELDRTEGELESRFAVDLKPQGRREHAWRNVTPEHRREARALLEKFVRQANEVLLIGLADKKVVLTDREVIEARREAAQSVLDAITAAEAPELPLGD